MENEAELIALSAEIVRRCAEAEHFLATRIDPLTEPFNKLLRARPFGNPRELILEEAFAFSLESGREAAIEALQEFDEATNALFCRLTSIPATTQPGRAAKVRALLAHVMSRDWRGPPEDLEWDIDCARALLGELAGMSANDLAAV